MTLAAHQINRPLASGRAAIEAAKNAARRFAAAAQAIDYDGAFPHEEFAALAARGLLAVALPCAAGGLGLGVEAKTNASLLSILKHIGRGNLSVGRIYEGHINALLLINTFGTPKQLSFYADEVRNDSRLFGVWNTQDAAGVKIQTLGNHRYRLHGAKTFASGGGHLQRPLITGALLSDDGARDLGWQMCIVPMDVVETSINASWWQPLGMRASASYRVDFTGVEIDESCLIGRPGDYYRQPWFGGGAIRFAAVQLGAAEALFAEMREYLIALDRTNDAMQQIRAGEIIIALESGRHWLRDAAALLDEYLDADRALDETLAARIVHYANMTRTAIEEICLRVMRLVERSVGARGLIRPHPIERIHRDLTMYLRQPAPDAVLTDVGRYALAHDPLANESSQTFACDEDAK